MLTGADIVAIGEEAELLVGGKNYNTALISQIEGIQAPYFRAISSLAFHRVLDETKVTGRIVRAVVDREYGRIDWNDPEINQDPDFLQKFVRQLGKQIHDAAAAEGDQSPPNCAPSSIPSWKALLLPEGIDQLRKRSVMVQAAILSVDLPQDVDEAVRGAYLSICNENGDDMTPVAVRSSAAGEDSRKKAFAGLQDTYLNMVGPAKVVEAYHWDCASAYNLRSMTYRREAILDAIARAEETGDEAIAINAKQEWAIENTSLSVCMMQMINPVISGTAFSADTSTGCRGTARKDLVSIDTSYGLGEAVVGGKVTPDKLYVFQRDDGSEVVIRQMGCKDMKIVYDERGGTREVAVPELEALRWALSLSQAERVAKGVRAVSKAYGGMIMDTEFCIDANDKLWFVQARPETRWNEELELHPTTIFMRRREVDAKAAANAEVLVEGNGSSAVPVTVPCASLAFGSGTEQGRQGRRAGRRAHRPRHGARHACGLRHHGRRVAIPATPPSPRVNWARRRHRHPASGCAARPGWRGSDRRRYPRPVYRGRCPCAKWAAKWTWPNCPPPRPRSAWCWRTWVRPCSSPVCASSRSSKWVCCVPSSCWATSASIPRLWKPSITANWKTWCRASSRNWKTTFQGPARADGCRPHRVQLQPA